MPVKAGLQVSYCQDACEMPARWPLLGHSCEVSRYHASHTTGSPQNLVAEYIHTATKKSVLRAACLHIKE
jgi:hypothetical protein